MRFDKTRPVSWSSISSFKFDKEQWYDKYVRGIKQESNKEMDFGRAFAKSIEDGTCKVPGLLDALQKKKEHPFQVMFGKIPLIGYADAFDDVTFRVLDEVKTGKKPWDKKRADEHGQIDMYLLMNLITNKVRPEEVKTSIYWVPTQELGDFSIDFVQPIGFKKFETKRTTAQVLAFGAHIQEVYKEMELFAATHP